ncbi:abscisic acid 8'-hydroxylase 4 [Carex littledalei]|uniref:Abscisic acid 8'-hydroxylase 4 n=1 Tax=Carex littledalei TaxID=544730 RepID=A0A833QYS9_9POAL|nr:abscisic acid 8'-hydroxylase 4 [Carex littledalei]
MGAITWVLLWVFKRICTNACTTTSHDDSKCCRIPPGSSGFPLVGETLAFVRAYSGTNGVYDFVRKRHLKYGDCFRTNIFGQTHVFISRTNVAKSLLGSESIDFSKRYIKSIGELLGKQSMLCSSHEHHAFLRRHISNLFTFDSLASFIEHFDELTVQILKQWERKKHVVVFDDAMKLTFRAICKMIMSLNEEEELKRLQHDIFLITEAMLSFPLRFPGTRFYEGLQARKRVMNALREKIALRRKGFENKRDFLQFLLSADQSDKRNGELLNDEQILDNILTLIIAGQVTTASAITWMVKYLDKHAEVQDKLREMQMDCKYKNSDSTIAPGTLNEMQYASKVVKETLRMATIVSWFPRETLKDCQIGEYQIKKGWIINVDARGIHYDSTIYNDPTKFIPSRFDEDPKSYSFLAFGAGGRTCLGMNLAKVMMLVFLHRLVTTYRWKVTDKDWSVEKWAMFPRLRNGCPITVYPLQDT